MEAITTGKLQDAVVAVPPDFMARFERGQTIDIRIYFDDSRNLEVVVHDAALAERAARVHAHLWDAPYTAPLEVLKTYSKPRR